ncbi:unnamed protein product [Urochloa humidicola]
MPSLHPPASLAALPCRIPCHSLRRPLHAPPFPVTYDLKSSQNLRTRDVILSASRKDPPLSVTCIACLPPRRAPTLPPAPFSGCGSSLLPRRSILPCDFSRRGRPAWRMRKHQAISGPDATVSIRRGS